LEVSWLVYLGSVYYIDDCKECFTFEHPNRDNPIDNSRNRTLEFKTNDECVITGFAGYFSSKLYKDIEISIHPETHTKAMRSWYSIYFPFPEPIVLEKNDRIEVAFWRKCDEKKIWYEYQMIAPKESEVINLDGKAHPILL
jgi:protein arginine N-methyltransferase 5